MMLSVSGNDLPHLHTPCPRCGYTTRYKQWPVRCLCNQDIWWRQMMANAYHERVIAPILAEQEQQNAALLVPTGPPLSLAPRYAAGRP